MIEVLEISRKDAQNILYAIDKARSEGQWWNDPTELEVRIFEKWPDLESAEREPADD